jgi:hypothetical protein
MCISFSGRISRNYETRVDEQRCTTELTTSVDMGRDRDWLVPLAKLTSKVGNLIATGVIDCM